MYLCHTITTLFLVNCNNTTFCALHEAASIVHCTYEYYVLMSYGFMVLCVQYIIIVRASILCIRVNL